MRFVPRCTVLFVLLSSLAVNGSQLPTTGQGLYRIGCAQCHGETGAGVPLDQVGFDVPLPDFADCSFATREPDFDWIAVSHQGGPVRGFDSSMPAFGEAFDIEQLQKVVDFIRTFCVEDAWPSGELNLPRPLFTEKAYPEDELIWTVGIVAEGKGELTNELLYERRFGARYQWELAVPFGAAQSTSGGPWAGGVGDVTGGRQEYRLSSIGPRQYSELERRGRRPDGKRRKRPRKGRLCFRAFRILWSAAAWRCFRAFASWNRATERS